jgi:hypothetical protein
MAATTLTVALSVVFYQLTEFTVSRFSVLITAEKSA